VEINFLHIFKTYTNKNNELQPRPVCMTSANLAPLKQDTISFKRYVFKKSDFQGTDLAVIERYKPNIQQFKSKEDLQAFALKEIEKLKEKNYGGRHPEIINQRKTMLDEWFNFVMDKNNKYSNTQRLTILSAITKDLKPNSDTIPQILNKEVLENTINEVEEVLKTDSKQNFDFNKIYKHRLRIDFIKSDIQNTIATGWVVIPSQKNDAQNFEQNVEKLKTLSHKTWCTKNADAKNYLSQGDFHIYLENNEPKIGIRFIGDKVEEIQSEKNNDKIPSKYLDIFEEYQNEKNLTLNEDTEYLIEHAKLSQLDYFHYSRLIGRANQLKTVEAAIKVLNSCGIQTEKDGHNKLIISKYCQPGYTTFEELGVDENKLFKYITEISNHANFTNSQATSLGSLEYIGADAIFGHSQITDLGNLKYIARNLDLSNSKLTNLGKLKRVGGSAYFSESKLKKLGNLEHIGQHAYFDDSEVTDLGKLSTIGGNLYLENSKLTHTKRLRQIDGDIYLFKSKLTKDSFENIKFNGKIYE